MIHIYKEEPFYKHELTWKVLVIERTNGKLGGFIELSLYPELPFVESSPVGYIEGWYVDEDLRSQGLGSGLVYLGEKWAKQKKCRHMASDVESDNVLSQQAHRSLGYAQAYKDASGLYCKKSI
nr:GNAT family N-acetyltransferase [Halobacillus locisalis]